MIERIDHFVMSVNSIDSAISFYGGILGITIHTFGDNRTALLIGSQKINLHEKDKSFKPHAKYPTVGSADICFIIQGSMEDMLIHLNQHGISVEKGPVIRSGARHSLISIYIRDPDDNLIELSIEKS